MCSPERSLAAWLSLEASYVISTILRHDRKQNSYKIALLRSMGDVALSYPEMGPSSKDVAVPLRLLAEFWIAYFWSFCDPERPILQGARSTVNGELREDVAFRPELTRLRREWESVVGTSAPSDGYFLIHELRLGRRRQGYPRSLLAAHQDAVGKIAAALRQPIQYAGPGHWSVFERPSRLSDASQPAAVIPGAKPQDVCVFIPADLWRAFHALSLWVEALCIHEWCLFSEAVRQPDERPTPRGLIYTLLTARPDNRRPLTWERNLIDVLILEGKRFVCPWTERPVTEASSYDIDHLLPVSVYPVNELWNLVPADAKFNQHVKRDRLPSTERLHRARPYLTQTYENYMLSPGLAGAIQEDVGMRFFGTGNAPSQPDQVADLTIGFVEQVATVRNLARF